MIFKHSFIQANCSCYSLVHTATHWKLNGAKLFASRRTALTMKRCSKKNTSVTNINSTVTLIMLFLKDQWTEGMHIMEVQNSLWMT